MKRYLAALLFALLLPAMALGEVRIDARTLEDGENRVVLFSAQAGDEMLPEEEQLAQEMKLLMIDGAISMRLGQARARQLYDNAQAGAGLSLRQEAKLYADDALASIAVLWNGTQPDGADACRPYTLMLNLQTGFEIGFDQLFADPDAAAAEMEAIIERDVLQNMNAYVETAELLPMPRSAFSVDEAGLTVYYDDSRYAFFDGQSGSVTFYWHEIAQWIGEDSPVYALSRAQAADADALRSAPGYFGAHDTLALGLALGGAMEICSLTDEPDYTQDAILYGSEDPELRGLMAEIPKYAETDEVDTPISAVRHSRVSWHGLTTGVTPRSEIAALLGEPDETILYDEDAAYAALLEPGESLLYRCSGFVLEAHLDAQGVLSCVILRSAMPESLY